MSPQTKKIFVVDSQKLNMIQMCMRRYKYQFGDSFEPIEGVSHFDKGTLIHHGLEFYYKARQIRNTWDEHGITHADVVQQSMELMKQKSLELNIQAEVVEDVIRTFFEYCERWQNDGWNDVLFVEKTASKVLYEDEKMIFLYEGKIDLGISLSNLPLVPVDHKSYQTKRWNSDLNNQFMGYCWLLSTPENPIHNIVVNKIGFYAESSKKKPEEKYYRETLSYTNARLEEWVQNSIFWLKQGVALIENNLYPMNLTSCDKYSGCSYRSVCHQNPADREEKLIELYQIKEQKWDVGSHLE